jgi:starch-binding outer membrane protein, SusD/RagB family
MDGADAAPLHLLSGGALLMHTHKILPTEAMKRIRKIGAFAAIAIAIAGCNDVLSINNPGAIQEGQLADPALVQLITNGVLGEFQYAYGQYAQWSAVLSDEAYTDHTNVDVRDFSEHKFGDLNTINSTEYEYVHRARQSADDAADRLKSLLGAAASSDLNVARVLAYGGYSYVLLGEGWCESPVNVSAPLSSDSLLRRAIKHFDEAITVATAGSTGANVAAAQDLINMSRVGAARAALKVGDATLARTYASLVPTTYEKLAYYSSNSFRENNALNGLTHASGASLAMYARFQGLNDPRVPQPATTQLGLTGGSIYTPLTPYMYTGWVATGAAPRVDVNFDIKFATGLEAQYVLAETDGPTPATLNFVNARRAVGGQGVVALTGAALMTELADQRARDFYLTGQRLGDLRRYAKAGNDMFPTGTYPLFNDSYGTAKCMIVPLSEKAGNPNY